MLFITGCFSKQIPIDNETTYALFKNYTDPNLDPLQQQWHNLLNHPEFVSTPVLVIELVAFASKQDKFMYLNHLKKLKPLIKSQQGKWRKSMNIIFTGIGDYSKMDFDQGLTTVIEYPSRAAYIKALTEKEYISTHKIMNGLCKQRMLLIGKDTRPKFTYWFNFERPAHQFQLPIVDEHPYQVLLEKLLKYFPDTHSDPHRKILERMFARKGFRNEPIYLMNLYDLGDKGDSEAQSRGETAHFNYYKNNILHALTRGIKTQFIAKIEHVMISPFDWDIVALNYWPSLANFTDFRLIPEYYNKTHQHRLNTGRNFGNFTHTLHPNP